MKYASVSGIPATIEAPTAPKVTTMQKDPHDQVIDAFTGRWDRATCRRGSRQRSRRHAPSCRCHEKQPENEQDDRIPHRFRIRHRAAGAASVVNQRAKEAENRRRGADREDCAANEWHAGKYQPIDRAEQEAHCSGDGVDDHHAPGTVEIRHGRRQLPHPQHVEEDVQQAAVEPAGREDRPPAPGDEYGQRAALAEPDQRLQVRRQDVERPAAVPQRIWEAVSVAR